MNGESNFKFLVKDFSKIFDLALQAEKNAISAPRTSLFYARLSLEQSIQWLYAHDDELEYPWQNSLASLIYEPSFQKLIPPWLFNGIQYVRKSGNMAVHDHREPTHQQAVGALKNLFQFCRWIFFAYGSEKMKIPPFNESLITGAGIKDKTMAEVQFLEKRYKTEIGQEYKRSQRTYVNTENEEKVLFRLEPIPEEFSRKEQTYNEPEDFDELETRKLFIDLLLREAGWDPDSPNVPEYPVTGMPTPTGQGYVDYVLWGDDGLPIAVVEAKKTIIAPHDGQHQASLYADCLEKKFDRRPVIYFTNGFKTWMWDDLNYPPREVMGFYTCDELQTLINRRTLSKPLHEFQVNPAISGRYYQIEAVRRVCEDFENRRRKALLVMATGSGKTRVAAALVDILARANWAQKILFLADRNALVRQAKNMVSEQLPFLSVVDITKEKEDDTSRMVFSTYQTMMNRVDGERSDDKRYYSVGHFDLVIIDEAHRSIYHKYQALFEYFDALWVGLTATPKSDVDRNTYEIFDREDHNPTYAYELKTAVDDKYLVPPKAASVPIKFPNEGIKYKDLTEQEKEEYEEKFYDEEQDVLPKAIFPTALNEWLFNTDTVDKVLTYLMDFGLKIESGDKLGKTIVFANNHKHALFIEERFNKLYPHLKGGFLRIIDNYERFADDLILKFSDPSKSPQIALSVDMLDTGIDVEEILNLVFFKRVRSSSKFWQMIGRGTRLCPNIFGPGDHKKCFYIFDFCENFEFFDNYPEGIEPGITESLNAKIFKARLQLSQLLISIVDQDKYNEIFRNELLDLLHRDICTLDQTIINVRRHLEYVVEFNNRERWNVLSSLDIKHIREELASLPPVPEDDEMARRFDLYLLNFMLSYLEDKTVADKFRENIHKIAHALEAKAAIPLVRAKMTVLKELQTSLYWETISLKKLENMRQELRELIRFLEKDTRDDVYTHFSDEFIGETVWREIIPIYTSMESYKQRVERFVRENQEMLVIKKLKYNIPMTSYELIELENILFDGKERGTKDDLNKELGEARPLGIFIRSIIGLDAGAAKQAFAGFLTEGNYTADQIRFINTIIDHLTQNGIIDKGMLFESPFTDIHDQGLVGVFGKASERDKIIEIIDRINSNAVA